MEGYYAINCINLFIFVLIIARGVAKQRNTVNPKKENNGSV